MAGIVLGEADFPSSAITDSEEHEAQFGEGTGTSEEAAKPKSRAEPEARKPKPLRERRGKRAAGGA